MSLSVGLLPNAKISADITEIRTFTILLETILLKCLWIKGCVAK